MWLRLFWLFWLFEDLSHAGRAQKHSIALLATEIPLSLNSTIILAGLLLQFYTNPLARLEMHAADVTDDGNPAIVELDDLTDREVGRIHSRSFDIVALSPSIVVCEPELFERVLQ